MKRIGCNKQNYTFLVMFLKPSQVFESKWQSLESVIHNSDLGEPNILCKVTFPPILPSKKEAREKQRTWSRHSVASFRNKDTNRLD